jgi:hypothetical protein
VENFNCFLIFTLNICSFVHQCNIHFLFVIIHIHYYLFVIIVIIAELFKEIQKQIKTF